MLHCLLEHGLDVNHRDGADVTALEEALMFNQVEPLRILLNHPAIDYLTTNALGTNFLHIAASYANIASLRILSSANLKGVNHTKQKAWGNSPLDRALWRARNNEEWSIWACQDPDDDPEELFNNFKKLLDSIDPDWRKVHSYETDDEVSSYNDESDGGILDESEEDESLDQKEEDGSVDNSQDDRNSEEGDEESVWQDALESPAV